MGNYPAKLKKHSAPILFLVAILILWDLFVRLFKVPNFILPAPSSIMLEMYSVKGLFLFHTLITVKEIILGFLVGCGLGFGLALAMNRIEFFRAVFYPLIIASQTTPKIAIAPLFIIWFGVGILPKIIIVALLGFFPILINTIAGLESTDQNMIDLMRSVAATETQIYRHIKIPMAIPFIFAGLKLSATVCVIGAIVGEWVAAYEGLGYLLLYYNSTLEVAKAFVAVFILMILGVATFSAIALLERYFSWEKAAVEGEASIETAM